MKEHSPNLKDSQYGKRRQRIHELLVALIQQQDSFSLMDDEAPPNLEGQINSHSDQDPALWLDRNRRVLKKYQALVRSAVTLDALMDAEEDGIHR